MSANDPSTTTTDFFPLLLISFTDTPEVTLAARIFKNRLQFLLDTRQSQSKFPLGLVHVSCSSRSNVDQHALDWDGFLKWTPVSVIVFGHGNIQGTHVWSPNRKCPGADWLDASYFARLLRKLQDRPHPTLLSLVFFYCCNLGMSGGLTEQLSRLHPVPTMSFAGEVTLQDIAITPMSTVRYYHYFLASWLFYLTNDDHVIINVLRMRYHDKHKQQDILTRLMYLSVYDIKSKVYEVPDLNSAHYSQHSQYLADLETTFKHAPVDVETRRKRQQKLRELHKRVKLPSISAACPSEPVLYNSQNYGEMFGTAVDDTMTKRWQEWLAKNPDVAHPSCVSLYQKLSSCVKSWTTGW